MSEHTTDQPLDPAAIMAEHIGERYERTFDPKETPFERLTFVAGVWCTKCADHQAWPCEHYRLAAALAAEQAKVQRVEALAEQWNTYYGSTAAGAARMVHMALAGDVNACGHIGTVKGCGGCDPGAIELVLDDGTRTPRNPTPADFA